MQLPVSTLSAAQLQPPSTLFHGQRHGLSLQSPRPPFSVVHRAQAVEKITADSLPGVKHETVAMALSSLVKHSADSPNVTHHILAPMSAVGQLNWVHKLIPGIERIAVEYHCGNFVVVRGSSEPFFESMPLYAR